MSKSIRNFLVTIVPIALLGLGAQVHAQANDVDCYHCVDTRDIDSEAITTNKIKKRAVTSSKLASRAITTGKIKDGAVTVAKVAPELSNAIGMFCLPDETVVGMDTSGNFDCELPQTLESDDSGNTRAGNLALNANTTGGLNTAVGSFALRHNTTGSANTAVGYVTLDNSNGGSNTAVGHFGLAFNTFGSRNTAVGSDALRQNTSGFDNTAVGFRALQNNSTGDSNIAIGELAGRNLTTGNNNIAIGNQGVAAEAGTIRIGHPNLQFRTFIAGIRNIMTGANNAIGVVIDSNGQLGTLSSSRRYKEQIHDMEAASERLLGLRPVTFRYKQAFEGGDKPIQFGLIAEEVAEVFPELVVYNDEGTPEAVKYRLLSTLLLNELQKQGAELRDMQARLVRLETVKAGAIANIK